MPPYPRQPLSMNSFSSSFSEFVGVQNRLTLLETFRADVWGNEHILREHRTRRSGTDIRTVGCLDFGKHLKAVQSFCPAIKDTTLIVVQEYIDAMNVFKSGGSGYENGACIIGQPGIGTTRILTYDPRTSNHELQESHISSRMLSSNGFVRGSP